MRKREPDRVVGLYDEDKGKCRLIWVENGRKRSLLLPCRAEAERLARELRAQLAPKLGATVADVVAAWAEERQRSGRCKPESTLHMLGRLRLFFGSTLAEDIRWITGARATKLYEQRVEQPTAKTGAPLSAATHRFDLWAARALFGWAQEHGYVAANPFAEVRPSGKVRAGKTQLRIGEARRFLVEALRRFQETGHPLALGALVALSMGLRTSEVLHRVVRDLDEGAQFLWVDGGKTENARRHLEVPAPLRPFLLQLAAGRTPEAPLFPSCQTGGFYRRTTMHRVVQEICIRAGVPRVSTHSLRGLLATLAVGAGAASHAVAAALGHHSFEVTQRHYAQPSAVTNAQTARVSTLLDMAHSTPENEALWHLLAQLPLELRAQVAAHLHTDTQHGNPTPESFHNPSSLPIRWPPSTER
ncbi:MAG: site-specific integrase [Polyangia bacterium]